MVITMSNEEDSQGKQHSKKEKRRGESDHEKKRNGTQKEIKMSIKQKD